LNITFLGTGTSQGVPVIGCECPICTSLDFRDKRLRTSIFISCEGKEIVVDTGPDFRAQMLREKIKKLDAVLFTHEHKDHTAGLDDVRSFNFLQKKDIPLYARRAVLENLKKEYSYIFNNNTYPGIPKVKLHEIDNREFSIDDLKIMPIDVTHYKLPVFGFRIGAFSYITDANYISDTELDKLRGSEVLVINALQHEPHISHFTLAEALKIIDNIQPKKAFITHISHKLGLHEEVEKMLPENVSIAYDGLKIEI